MSAQSGLRMCVQGMKRHGCGRVGKRCHGPLAIGGLAAGWLVVLALGWDIATAATPAPPVAPAAPGEEPIEPPTYTSVRAMGKGVTLATLSNGLTVLVQENHTAPVATVRCFVKNTGSAFEGRFLGAGLSHVLEHVVAGGTNTKRTAEQVEAMIDSFGGATNAYTSDDLTAFFIDCPSANAMTAIELVADSMQRITFAPEEFDRELRVVRQELADGEVDRSRVLWKLLGQTVYLEHPARHPVIGYLDVLQGTTNEAIVEFYHERYVPNNQVFVVTGDVATADVLAQVARQWLGTPRGHETLIAFPEEPAQMAPREAVREMDGSTYDLAIAWPTVELSSGDLYALDLAAYILGQGDSSRLVARLKYDEGIVLSVNTASYTPWYVRGWFGVFASLTPENRQRAEEEILQEVYRLRDELVERDELAKAKKQKSAELVFGQQTVQQAAESLGRGYITSGDPLFDEKYVANIQRVTAEQIRDVARRYFVPSRINRITIAPPGGGPEPAAAGGKQVEGQLRLQRLANGLRVLVKRDDRLPMVNMQAFVLGGGLVDTPENAGRSSLVGAMLDKGTANHSAREIALYFDSIGGQIGMTAGRNTIYGSATVLAEDVPRAAALFAECFTQPDFPEDEFRRIKSLALGAIARRNDDPQQEAMEVLYQALPAGSPYHVIQGGTRPSVEKITADDLRAYHARYFVPQNMLVTIFGQIDEQAAIKLAEQHFGALEPAADPPAVPFDRPNVIAQDIVRHKQTQKPTGVVLLAYRGTSILNAEEHAALTVLDTVMSGYSYPGGWLHTELRGEGLVYGVHALLMTGPAPGFFVVVAQTRPDATEEVVKRIETNVAKARAGQITAEEFNRAKQAIIALHAQENTTIAGQAQQAALDELYGLGYDYDQTFDERIEAVELKDVVAVAQRLLTQRVLVTASPQVPGR